MRRLEDRVIVVTGGGRGIGRATALRLASEGARVVIADFDHEGAQSAAAEVQAKGGKAHAAKVDVSERASVKKLVETVMGEHGQLDGWINNAGIIADSSLAKLTDENMERVIKVNLMGTFICAQEAAAVMKPRKNSSVLGFVIEPSSA